MRKRFGIDIDGTVTTPDAIIPFMNADFGLTLTLDDIKSYDLSVHVDINESEFSKWWLSNEAKIYEHSPINIGVKDVLLDWSKHHDLYFISARSKHLLTATKEWFVTQGLPFHHIELIGSHYKTETIKRYDIEIFFEDKHDNAVEIWEQCQIPVILFNTPYNQEPLPKGVTRVQNWSEAKFWVEKWLDGTPLK